MKFWKSFHGYIGLTIGLLLVVTGITGFFMIDKEKPGLKEAVSFAPISWWYSNIPQSKNNEKSKIEYLILYTSRGESVQVAADRGSIFLKSTKMKEWKKVKDSPWRAELRETPAANMGPRYPEPLTWRKLVVDLHSGKFFAGRLDWFYRIAALMLVLLVCSGLYLWIKPKLDCLHRKNSKIQAELQ
jgi:hypothetical protein